MGRDGLAGLVVLATSLYLYWTTFAIEANPLVPVSPAFYPRLVIAGTALLAVLLVVSDVLARRRRAPVPAGTGGEPAPRPRYGMVLLLFAIFGAYVLALPYAGFRLATPAFVAAMQVALARPRGARGWALVAAVALVTTFGVYVIFDQYLQVLLPRGLWSGF